MSVYAIKLDTERCISCHACEVHCQAKNCLPQGAKLGRLFTVGPALLGGKARVVSAFLPCFHCEQPWCVPACPTGAMQRRESDGVVFVEASLCVGCKGCIDACPWKVPQWDASTGKVIKCDYCRDRVDEGQAPACVAGCTTSALSFSRPNSNSKRARAAFAKLVATNKQARRSE
jgi:Fe-S-cluster-containing dehydrogenase component